MDITTGIKVLSPCEHLRIRKPRGRDNNLLTIYILLETLCLIVSHPEAEMPLEGVNVHFGLALETNKSVWVFRNLQQHYRLNVLFELSR